MIYWLNNQLKQTIKFGFAINNQSFSWFIIYLNPASLKFCGKITNAQLGVKNVNLIDAINGTANNVYFTLYLGKKFFW